MSVHVTLQPYKLAPLQMHVMVSAKYDSLVSLGFVDQFPNLTIKSLMLVLELAYHTHVFLWSKTFSYKHSIDEFKSRFLN